MGEIAIPDERGQTVIMLQRLAFAATLFILGPGIFTPHWAKAQNIEQSATYVSQVDEDLTIRRVAILPVVDNVDGIYARPIEAQLTQLVRALHRWDFVESNMTGEMPSALDLEENPTEIQKITRPIDADAFIVAAASKGPNGLSIRLDMFLKKDGKLLAQEILKDHPRFQIAEVREQVNLLFKRLVAKLPYDGIILSRQANRVTINLGRSDGLVKDQTVTAVQIISLNRHPKFNFIISSDKEILGRIKILKVDETLSFGAIVSEKEKGAIRRMAKIAGLEPVNYPAPDRLGSNGTDLNDRTDAPLTFGKDPKEWVPQAPPSFGLVGVKVGLGQFNSSVNLDTVGSLEAKTSLYPSLDIFGELWLNPYWTVRAEFAQGIISTSNPRSGSTPNELNQSMTKYSLELGYNFLLQDDFFGPKLQLSAGFGSNRMFVDDSQPQALTTTTFSGAFVGLSGSFPVTDDKLWYLGGKMNLYLLPQLQETPNSSAADSKATVNDFSLFGERKIGERLRALASLDFALYSASMSGQGSRVGPGNSPERATSLSQKHTTVSFGIMYLF